MSSKLKPNCHLWGDVPALMPMTKGIKNSGGSWFNVAHNTTSGCGNNPDGRKVPGFRFDGSGKSFQSQSVESTGVKVLAKGDGVKIGGTWFHDETSPSRMHSSKSSARKRASAMIAKIPIALSRHIARVFHPEPIRSGSAPQVHHENQVRITHRVGAGESCDPGVTRAATDGLEEVSA